MHDSTEFIADELNQLVGWGAHPKRVALLPNLRRQAGITEGMKVGVIGAGYLVRQYIADSIRDLGPVEFMGRQVEAHTLQRVLRLLLQLEGTGQSAENRRYRAITVLGVSCSIDQWRRPCGPERDLMRILASAMTNHQT
jgi:hypothetical protein